MTPPGELDPETAPDFEKRLGDLDAADEVVVDFTQVNFCDSSGLRILLVAYRRHDDAGGSFAIVNCSDQLRRIFEITELDFLLDGLTPEA